MITPFSQSDEVDYLALEELIEWYISNKVNGLFAVCQSSEMFYLTLEERIKIAAFVNEKAAGRVPVIASGHISDSFDDQIKEINLMAGTGVAAVVLITNKLAGPDDTENEWLKNLERLMGQIPQDINLGLYECPYPYKRIISPELLKICGETERFTFIKDTCCDIDMIKEKIMSVSNSGLKLFNANTATLLKSLEFGAAGYSGVMANFHPLLYSWLLDHWNTHPQKALLISNFLTMASWIERQLYPVNAKYHSRLEGLNMELFTRSRDSSAFSGLFKLEIEELQELEKAAYRYLEIGYRREMDKHE